MVHGDDFTFTGDGVEVGGTHEWVVRGEGPRAWTLTMGGVVSFVLGENRSSRALVLAALHLQEDSVSLTSPGTEEVDKDDDSLPKVLGE